MSKQPESKLSTKIMKAWRNRGAFCYKVHGSEMQMAGVPDISGTFRGWSVWCETKMPGNAPSAIQLHRIKQIRAAGGLVVVAYSVKEATELIDHLEGGTHGPECHCDYSVPGDK